MTTTPDALRKLILTAPERIYLQFSDDEGDTDLSFSEAAPSEITWCADSVVACEVAYVRADFADQLTRDLEQRDREIARCGELFDALTEAKNRAEDQVESLRAQLAEARKDGYVIVPREPTDDMIDEGHDSFDHKTGNWGECPGLTWGDARDCYKAMIAVAIAADAGKEKV